jgi:hypothetical protein
MCFGGPKIPTPAPAPAAPQAINPATQGASETALARSAAAGASSTMITGPQGILGSNMSAGKTLLGG